MSKIRATLVSDAMLSKLARRINLDNYILLGINEEKNQGRNKNSTLACAFEAVLGALYLLTSIECVNSFLTQLYKDDVIEIDINYEKYNAKIENRKPILLPENISPHTFRHTYTDPHRRCSHPLAPGCRRSARRWRTATRRGGRRTAWQTAG